MSQLFVVIAATPSSKHRVTAKFVSWPIADIYGEFTAFQPEGTS